MRSIVDTQTYIYILYSYYAYIEAMHVLERTCIESNGLRYWKSIWNNEWDKRDCNGVCVYPGVFMQNMSVFRIISKLIVVLDIVNIL